MLKKGAIGPMDIAGLFIILVLVLDFPRSSLSSSMGSRRQRARLLHT